MTLLVLLVFLVLLAAVRRERRTRRAFAEDGPAFRCRVRFRRRWSRRMWACWAGELLLIRRGPVFDRTLRLPVRVLPPGVHRLPAGTGRRCGPDPIVVRLVAADGTVFAVVAAGADRVELVGPYLAAAFSDLPRAPVRRREI
ncbi:hypothetical protein ACWT_3883 [Actinoplanes sp. SE50]|uniref:hypothetical protein n=1 Tax=unclassified Actinoplanes TaxID=2626549 RepID=UPI00023ED089|nr:MULTISPECIES: hypothetical protein [unclassified Actinoplanes]AEV84907.1 hypothetical protein ACPL_4012 [Actinoplanes sp. SE50/110]ATO83298.1 hypothetical protein ACWT_3883 [Actinoplanes sp. SE50]SLM00705.1 hypothetical protein ACSP50_3938 [Actinoplanes sp. SE50/110]